MTRDINTGLARGGQAVQVASHSASASYKGKPIDARAVGRELGVRYVVEGEVRRGDDKEIVSVQVVISLRKAKGYSSHPAYARQAEAHLYPGLRKAGVPE